MLLLRVSAPQNAKARGQFKYVSSLSVKANQSSPKQHQSPYLSSSFFRSPCPEEPDRPPKTSTAVPIKAGVAGDLAALPSRSLADGPGWAGPKRGCAADQAWLLPRQGRALRPLCPRVPCQGRPPCLSASCPALLLWCPCLSRPIGAPQNSTRAGTFRRPSL